MWASHPTKSAAKEQSVGVDAHIDPRSEEIIVVHGLLLRGSCHGLSVTEGFAKSQQELSKPPLMVRGGGPLAVEGISKHISLSPPSLMRHLPLNQPRGGLNR